MKIISWNCNGGFRKKYHLLEKIDADILIIQECENPQKTSDTNYIKWAENYIWIGENKNKGLGIFCKSTINILDNNWKTDHLKYFISAKINNEFNLIGLWNHHANSPTFKYIGQFWKYLQINKSKMKDSLIIGDFNSNSIWDVWDRWWNHSDVVKELNEMNIRSLYHEFYNEEQGKETTPTFYLQKKLVKKYHIDYAFADKKKFPIIKNLLIGNHTDWLNSSDHMPIYIEI